MNQLDTLINEAIASQLYNRTTASAAVLELALEVMEDDQVELLTELFSAQMTARGESRDRHDEANRTLLMNAAVVAAGKVA